MGEIITDQPVMRTTDKGVQKWYLNNKLHRTDGPAYIYGDFHEWYLNGKRHRTDGPAVIAVKYQIWYLNGKFHRTDGPAFISGEYQEWHLNGNRYEFNEWVNNIDATPEEKTMLRLKWAK